MIDNSPKAICFTFPFLHLYLLFNILPASTSDYWHLYSEIEVKSGRIFVEMQNMEMNRA